MILSIPGPRPGKPAHYRAIPLPRGAARLARVDAAGGIAGPEYDLARAPGGRVECSCPDYQLRRKADPKAGPCKHGKAALAAGLLGAARNRPLSSP